MTRIRFCELTLGAVHRQLRGFHVAFWFLTRGVGCKLLKYMRYNGGRAGNAFYPTMLCPIASRLPLVTITRSPIRVAANNLPAKAVGTPTQPWVA